jgi:putative NIF3 family GTP cyclohydrolase 1 type 2
MALLNEMLAELDRLLDPDSFADHGPNGLQVQGCAEVTHVATGVSASVELFERAIDAGAQLILTHHGLFWDGDDPRVVGALRDQADVCSWGQTSAWSPTTCRSTPIRSSATTR